MIRFLHRQQRHATCAVACVRTVLHRQFGLRVSEAALVALGTTPEYPIVKTGSYTSHMRQMVRSVSSAYNSGAAWGLFVRTRGTLAMLRRALARGRWPICQVFVREVGEFHAVVIMDITAESVLVFDPDPTIEPNPRWYSRADFVAWWTAPKSGDTWYAVLSGGVLKEHQ